jgi:hypothetical protein
MKTTVPLNFLIRKSNRKVLRFINILNYRDQNRLHCENCRYDKGCYCSLFNNITTNTTSPLAGNITSYIWKKEITEINISIYDNNIISIEYCGIKPCKLKNINELIPILNEKRDEIEYFGSNINTKWLTIYYKEKN